MKNPNQYFIESKFNDSIKFESRLFVIVESKAKRKEIKKGRIMRRRKRQQK